MYRSINGDIWLDKKFRQLSADAKLVFIYSFSNIHTNVAGLYFLPSEYILVDVGMPLPRAEVALQELIDLELISRFDKWIFVHGMVKHQSHSPKIVEAIRKAFDKCESDSLKSIFVEHFKDRRWDWCKWEPKESNKTQKGKSDTLSVSDTDTDTATDTEDTTQRLHSSTMNSISSNNKKDVPTKTSAEKPMAAVPATSPLRCGKNAKEKQDPEDLALAQWMVGLVRKVAPSAKLSRDWCDVIRRMREQDNHTHDEIRAMFQWAHDDIVTDSTTWRGWRFNILSPGKLRKKWPELEAQRNGPPPLPRRPARTDEKAWHELARHYQISSGYAEEWPSYQRRIWDAVVDHHRQANVVASNG